MKIKLKKRINRCKRNWLNELLCCRLQTNNSPLQLIDLLTVIDMFFLKKIQNFSNNNKDNAASSKSNEEEQLRQTNLINAVDAAQRHATKATIERDAG